MACPRIRKTVVVPVGCRPRVIPGGKASTTTRPADLSSLAQPGTATSQERESKNEHAPEPAGLSEEEFAEKLTRMFVADGKDNPTPKQIRDVMDGLPIHNRARSEFLVTLRKKIRRLKHPGALPSLVEGFNARWPVWLEVLDAERPLGGETDESASRSDQVRLYLRKNAEALRQAACHDETAQMEDMAAGPLDDEEDVEWRLGILEQGIVEKLRSRQSEKNALATRMSLECQLRPYRGNMTADQLAMLESQYLARDLLEKAKIPWLSLFYL